MSTVFYPLHRSSAVLLCLLCGGVVSSLWGQCLSSELALIHSCVEHPNPNGGPLPVESELLVVSSGLLPVAVNDIRIDIPFNGIGPANADISQFEAGDCRFKVPTIRTLPGCANVIPLGPGDSIPPQSFVVIFTTGTTVSEDVLSTSFENICPLDRPIYILQNACERTAGAFANSTSTGDPIRTIGVESPCGLSVFSYNTRRINPADGTYYLIGSNTAGNLNCDLPEIPETCPAIDTTYFICDLTMSQATVPATELSTLYVQEEVSVSFHPTAAAAETNVDRITEYRPSGQPTDTIWARLIYAENFCIIASRLIIRYQTAPAFTNVPAEPLLGCPDGTGLGRFNLRLLDEEIGAGQPVTYYTDLATTNEILNPESFTSVAVTIFAVAGVGDCRGNVVPVELSIDNFVLSLARVGQTSCAGQQDGSIEIRPSGNGPFSYEWAGDTLPFSGMLDRLPAADYRVTVTNGIGCTATQVITVSDGLPPQMSCRMVAAPSSATAADGVVRVEIAEGVRPYSVAYTGAAAGAITVDGATGDISGLPAGTYDITVTDAAGCVSETCTAELREILDLTLACTVVNNSDGTTVFGTIRSDISGGIGPYLVQLTNAGGQTTDFPDQPAGSIVFSDLVPGDYTVTVTDAAGEVRSCTQRIVLISCPLTITDVRQFPVGCDGTDPVIVSIGVAGATGAVSTMWLGPNNVEQYNGMQDAGPLMAGEYFVVVSDESGCAPLTEGPIVVTDPVPAQYAVTTNGASSPCTPSGSIAVSFAGGGWPPFTAVLVDAVTDTELARFAEQQAGDVVNFTDLAGADAGPNYYVYVTDDNGCSLDTSFLFISGAPAEPIRLAPAEQTLIAPACAAAATGRIELSAGGGTGNYTYRWIDYPERESGRILADGATQTDLPAGTYVVEIVDDEGCTGTFTLTLEAGTGPNLTCGNTTEAVGNGTGSVSVSIDSGTGPYQLVLTDAVSGAERTVPGLPEGATTVDQLTAGTYSGVVTDSNGCTSEPCSFVIDPAPCALALSASLDSVTCTGPGRIAVAVVNAGPGLDLAWEATELGDSSVVFPADPGRYNLTVSDDNGCRIDTFFTIFARDDAPTLMPGTTDRIRVCTDETIAIPLTFTGRSPFTLAYELRSPDTPAEGATRIFSGTTDTLRLLRSDFTADSATLTFLSLTDDRCAAQLSLPALDLSFVTRDTVRRFVTVCDQAPILLGGRSFTPASPSDTFTLMDGSTCGTRYEVDVTFLDGMAAVPDTVDVQICPGTEYTAPGSGEVFNADRPQGEVRYPRPEACDSVVYFRLFIPPVNVGAYGEERCAGDTIFYGDRFFTADNPGGLVMLPGQGANGCDSLVTVSGNFQRTGELRLFGDATVCRGDSVDLRFTYDGPDRINAIIGDGRGNSRRLEGVGDNDSLTLLPPGNITYRILSVATDRCPGEASGSATVTVTDLQASATALVDPRNYCVDTLGKGIVIPSGGSAPYLISWSNGGTDSLLRNLTGGTYVATVTDGTGCTAIDSFSIGDQQDLRVEITAVPPACPGGKGKLRVDTLYGGSGFYEVSLDGTFFVPIARIGDFNLPPGLGTAIVQDVNDCRTSAEFFVPPATVPDFTLVSDTTIRLGDSLVLEPQLDFAYDTAFWSPPSGLRTPNQLVTVARPAASSNYRLTLRTPDGCEFTELVSILVDESLPYFAPTVFSPNSDGVNDLYALNYGPQVVEQTSFQIFNRWGHLMHTGPDAWDGNIQGMAAPAAVYVFYATVRMADGSERSLKGDFILMR